MGTPAYIDTSLYLPAGGVNGFEINGHAINGAGFVDSPFAGGVFELDPYRSIFPVDRVDVGVGTVFPSVLPTESDLSYEVAGEPASEVWAPRCAAEVVPERVESKLAAQVVSLALEVESVSLVPVEYRTAYVLATHPSSTPQERTDSNIDELAPSENPDDVNVSVVPPEYRTAKVPRGDS